MYFGWIFSWLDTLGDITRVGIARLGIYKGWIARDASLHAIQRRHGLLWSRSPQIPIFISRNSQSLLPWHLVTQRYIFSLRGSTTLPAVLYRRPNHIGRD